MHAERDMKMAEGGEKYSSFMLENYNDSCVNMLLLIDGISFGLGVYRCCARTMNDYNACLGFEQ